MPTIHALLWYSEFHGHTRKAALHRSTLDVHVITDNRTTVTHWEALTRGGPKAQKIRRKRPLWNVLLQLERAGYIIHFHWVARCTIGLNTLADEMAGAARDAITGVTLKTPGQAARQIDREIYTVDASA